MSELDRAATLEEARDEWVRIAHVANDATPNPTTTAAVTREERRARRARS